MNHRHLKSGAVNQLALPAVLLFSFLLACEKRSDSTPPQSTEITEKPVDVKPVDDRARPSEDPFNKTFAQATRAEPPEGWQPVEKTITGKSVGKLYETVKESWDSIPLTGKDGKPLALVATLETDLGPIEITLRPDLAPNHVRNFLALVQAGYYDGLVFERQITQAQEGKPDDALRCIEAGCPLGTGDSRVGSLGYWLKQEDTKKATHEIGTVGACHEIEADTAACKFYITLSEAPFLDESFTIFGKVTRGLDIAKKIYQRPVRADEEDPEGGHPVNPVVIKKVVVQSN